MSRRRRSIAGAARAAVVVPGVVLGLALAPALAPAANASFASNATAATSYSAATLVVPSAAAFPVSARCLNILGIFDLSITATGIGTVQYANHLEMTVRDPGGVVRFTGDLSSPSQRTYSTITTNSLARGTWTYEIRAQYTVPNSSNVWSSQPLTRTVVCS